MNSPESKSLVSRNWIAWLIAALVYPVAHWIPTSTGHPPKIFDVLAPVFIMGLGYVSHSILSAALKSREGN